MLHGFLVRHRLQSLHPQQKQPALGVTGSKVGAAGGEGGRADILGRRVETGPQGCDNRLGLGQQLLLPVQEDICFEARDEAAVLDLVLEGLGEQFEQPPALALLDLAVEQSGQLPPGGISALPLVEGKGRRGAMAGRVPQLVHALFLDFLEGGPVPVDQALVQHPGGIQLALLGSFLNDLPIERELESRTYLQRVDLGQGLLPVALYYQLQQGLRVVQVVQGQLGLLREGRVGFVVGVLMEELQDQPDDV